MRFLAIVALSLLCLAPYQKGMAGKLVPANDYSGFPSLHIVNDTAQTHSVFVEYARGFKIATIGGKVTIDKFVHDDTTYENLTTGPVTHEVHFNRPFPPRKPWRKATYRYKVTVYEEGNDVMKCSSIISVSPSAAEGAWNGANLVGQDPCIATARDNSACTLKAQTYGLTCQVELTISDEVN